MNYEQAIEYIENTSKYGNNAGTKRVETILELLGNPHKELKCIHVAGTNGKGSTTAMISQILIESGYKVGMYTSPYLEEFEERIQINGENIPKDRLSSVITKVFVAVEKIIEEWGSPTEFEIITCAMFLYYYEEKIDYAVIEVGLGGRMDSTNVITPLVSVITSISFDHMGILGDTLEKIAYEKGGIIKEGVPVVLYPQEEEAENVIRDICSGKDSFLIKVDKYCVKEVENLYNVKYQKFIITTEEKEYNVQLSLLGVHQILNSAVVLNTIEQLQHQGVQIKEEHIKEGLKKVKWAGRMEIIQNNPMVLLDGAHNIDGINKLSENVKKYFKYNNLILIIGILADKQVEEMIKTITPLAHKVIAITPHSYRAENAEKLGEIIKKYNNSYEKIEDYKEAYVKALSYCGKDDMVLVCGSLYMIGDMRKIVRQFS
ncbi:folylpolyglutamate synthase/dihydrofolate synthase family protein [Clostridium malenominatum]|uniref:tetrahydrofolate synthase n=1 Tax=Clostridium malenominatum TaxID=1539 RepID=A0ABN1IPD3_9CLOT